MKNRNRTIKMMAAVASLSLIAAACGSDGNDTSSASTDAPTQSDAPTEAPASTDGMDDTSDGPFGPACDAVPADGAGSFAGMAEEPAATAASNNPLLSTLVTAVTEAGLVDTLNSDGPFTIFAPTNDAFAAIPADDLDAVLADKELLTSILTYHVVAGESLDAAGLGAAGILETVNGAELEFSADGTQVNGVDVLCSNVMTANATVHIIGEVLMPPADDMTTTTDAEMEEGAALEPSGALCAAIPADGEGSFAGMAEEPAATAASNNPELSTLVTALTEAGLVDTLNSDGPFTIFAPANSAFAAIPADDLDAVLADKDLLTSILTLHVISGEKLSSEDLAGMDSATTVNGQDITFEVQDDGTLMVNGQATVGCADVSTANATVHIIDAVMMPS